MFRNHRRKKKGHWQKLAITGDFGMILTTGGIEELYTQAGDPHILCIWFAYVLPCSTYLSYLSDIGQSLTKTQQ